MSQHAPAIPIWKPDKLRDAGLEHEVTCGHTAERGKPLWLPVPLLPTNHLGEQRCGRPGLGRHFQQKRKKPDHANSSPGLSHNAGLSKVLFPLHTLLMSHQLHSKVFMLLQTIEKGSAGPGHPQCPPAMGPHLPGGCRFQDSWDRVPSAYLLLSTQAALVSAELHATFTVPDRLGSEF